MRKVALITGFGLFVSLLASPAHADLVLRLTDSATASTITVTDQTAGDSNPLAGVVTFIGSVGTWLVNVSTGEGSPLFNPSQLDLNSVDSKMAGTPSSTLSILLTQTNLTDPLSSWNMNFGGTLNSGTVTFDAWRDNTNAQFGMGTLIGSLGAFGPPSFSGSTGGGASGVTPYSLTERVQIVAGAGAVNYSGDAELLPTPEPGSLTLLGTGLLGFVRMARRRMQKTIA